MARFDERAAVARTIRSIFTAEDEYEAKRLLDRALASWQSTKSKLAAWAEVNLAEGFAVFQLPARHRVRMRTTNGFERLNKELKRRTRVATLFPNPTSRLRLISDALRAGRKVADRENLPDHETRISNFLKTSPLIYRNCVALSPAPLSHTLDPRPKRELTRYGACKLTGAGIPETKLPAPAAITAAISAPISFPSVAALRKALPAVSV